MNKSRIATVLSLATGLILLIAALVPTRADGAANGAMQALTPASPGPPLTSDSLPDYFAGLNYTDDQKTEIARIRHDIDVRKGVVANDNNLKQDQKDAMILGYTHLENGEIFKVLTPEQRRQVRQRLLARSATEEAAQIKRPAAN